MLFFSFFKTLVGKEVAVELKNDVVVTGTLVSVDQYLNVKLTNVNVVDTERYPQLVRFCVCVSQLRGVLLFPSRCTLCSLVSRASLSSAGGDEERVHPRVRREVHSNPRR